MMDLRSVFAPLPLPYDTLSPRRRLQRGLALIGLLMSALWFVFYELMQIAFPLNRSLYGLLLASSLIALLAPPRAREKAVELGLYFYLSVLLVAWIDAFYYSYGSVIAQLAVFKVMIWLPAVYGGFFLVYRAGAALGVGAVTLSAFIMTSVPHALETAGGGALFDGFLLPLAFLVGHSACLAGLYLLSRAGPLATGVSSDVEQLQKLAYYDALTGLPNRLQMNLLLQDALVEARKGRAFALILVSVDHVKQITGAFGPHLGDLALSNAARRLAEPLRTGDVLGRWDSGAFAVVVRRPDDQDALRRAETLRAALSAQPLVGGVTLTVSCGVAAYRPGDTLERLLGRASGALSAAQRGSHDHIGIAFSELN